MFFRSLTAAVVGLCTTVLGITGASMAAAQQTGGAPKAAASAEPLSDGILRAMGIEREWLGDNEKLKAALTEAAQKFQAGDANETLKKLEEAVKADGSLPPAELLLARLLVLANNINQGRQIFDQVAAKHPECPEVYMLLGNLALGEGRLTDAYLEYTWAGQLVGEGRNVAESKWSEQRRKDFLREIYSGKAAVFEQLQNWERAKNELIPWKTMNPADPLVHLREGRILYMEGVKNEADDRNFAAAYAKALTELQEAYRLQREAGIYKNDPVIERPEVILLQLHTVANKLDLARDEIAKLAADEKKLQDDDSKEAGRIFTQISTWYLRQGEFDDARKYASKATALDKDSPALKALSAMLSYYANDPKAEEDFAKMHAESPGDFFSSNYLALILGESKDEAKRNRAVQLAEMNARLNPKSPEALATLGWCYYNVGKYQDALKVMEVFTQGAQISPDTAYYFAKVLFAANRFATRDVFNLLDSAINAKGPFKHRQDADQWMRGLRGETSVAPESTSGTTPPKDVVKPADVDAKKVVAP